MGCMHVAEKHAEGLKHPCNHLQRHALHELAWGMQWGAQEVPRHQYFVRDIYHILQWHARKIMDGHAWGA